MSAVAFLVNLANGEETRDWMKRYDLVGGLRPAALQEIGASERDLFIRNFEALPPNKRFPSESTGFWKRAARATSFEATGATSGLVGAVTVIVDQIGVEQRLKGGPIAAVNAKYLTIPARAEAYGKSAREFSNLRFVAFASGAKALVETDHTTIAYGRGRKDGTRKVSGTTRGGMVMFWLKRSVNQQPNRGVIPSDVDMGRTAVEGLKRAFEAGL